MKPRLARSVSFFIVFLFYFFLFRPADTNSANLHSVKDTLQTSRLSFAGRVKSPTASGSSHLWLYTTGTTNLYSVSTAGLKVADTLTIGTGSYTIASIIDADEFTVTPSLSVGDAVDGTTIYFSSRPQHVITFTTASAIANGFFRVLLPAAASGANDSLPDSAGFDFGGTVDVSAVDASGYTFSSNAATASGGTGCTAPANYHCFEFHYTGTGGVGIAITLKIGNTSGTNTPLAPAPSSSHTAARADIYPITVQNFTAGADPVTAIPQDQTHTKIGVIESVRVTATVDQSLSFGITGVASGANPCGTGTANQTDIDTTTGTGAPLAVSFGTLSLNTFKDAAHLFTVSTNAANGYVVTAQENDQLGKDGGTAVFIPDTSGDNGTATETNTDTWDTAASHPGFGYTLKSVSGATVPFSSTGTAFNARRFPSLADPDSPAVQTVMSSTSTAASHTANLCYRITIGGTQAAGTYFNKITYTATASF